MHSDNTDANDDFDDDFKSKTQLKKEAQALTDLGSTLVKMSPRDLTQIPLDEELRDAIKVAQNIHKHGGLKRQLMYIGKMLRKRDTAPIEAAYQALQERDSMNNARFHRLEHWRDRLLDEGDSIIGDVLEEMPMLDRQQLRQLLRNAATEKVAGKPPASARALFKYLREAQQD